MGGFSTSISATFWVRTPSLSHRPCASPKKWSKACQAYKILRRHAKLIINLLYLMVDSGIKDLCGDPQFAILKVEQKFQALMDDEQAEEHFLNLIDESVNALFPVMMESSTS